MKNRKLYIHLFSWTRVVFYISISYAIYYLISNSATLVCHWNERYGVLCPACGATRATLNIIQTNFLAAIKFNLVYAVAIFPIALIFILEDICVLIYRSIKKKSVRSLVEVFLGVDNIE